MKQLDKYIVKGLILFSLLVLGTVSAQADYTYSWAGWTAGDTSRSLTNVDGSGVDVDVVLDGNGTFYNSNYPDDATDTIATSLDVYVNNGDVSDEITTTIDFSYPVNITHLQIRDIDSFKDSVDNFQDRIIIKGYNKEGVEFYPDSVVLGDTVQNTDPNGEGDYQGDFNVSVNDDNTSGWITVKFSDYNYVRKMTITYTNGLDVSGNPTGQHILIDDINFTLAPDRDGDGVADTEDIDDDNDGILDSIEYQGGGKCVYGFFQTINDGLYILDYEEGDYALIGDVDTSRTYNAMAYNELDGNLYALFKETTDYTDAEGNTITEYDVIRISRQDGSIHLFKDNNGNAVNLGGSSISADIENGIMYFLMSATQAGTDTDVARPLDIANKVFLSDIEIGTGNDIPNDVSILNGIAYGVEDNDGTEDEVQTLYQIYLDGSAKVNPYTVTLTGATSGGNGASFIAKNPTSGAYELYVGNNGSGTFRIDGFQGSTPTAVRVADTIPTNRNDGASCPNANQYAADTDGDGIPDYWDLDSDNDGIPDNIEGQSTTNVVAPSGTDSDGDGLDDAYDQNTNGTDASYGSIPPDRDRDGSPDFVDSDSDNDGYTDCEEGITQSVNCPIDYTQVTVGINGLADDLEGGSDQGYTDVNNSITNPNPDNGGTDLQNEVTGNDEAAYREFLCGKALTTLTERNWKLISIPCDTDTQDIQALFGDNQLGTYGEPSEGGTWVMYKQSAALPVDSTTDDNFEVNATHTNTNKTKLTGTSTLELGASYWIIWDDGDATTGEEINITIDKTLSQLAPTSTVNAEATYGIQDPDVSEVYNSVIPDNDDDTSVVPNAEFKKYMAGNPFPYAFTVKNLYFSHGGSSGSYYPIGDSTNDTYINSTFYKHDAPDIGPITGYTAVNPTTPGFDEGGIKPMEGFFMRVEMIAGDTAENNFAYPLMMQNGSGN